MKNSTATPLTFRRPARFDLPERLFTASPLPPSAQEEATYREVVSAPEMRMWARELGREGDALLVSQVWTYPDTEEGMVYANLALQEAGGAEDTGVSLMLGRRPGEGLRAGVDLCRELRHSLKRISRHNLSFLKGAGRGTGQVWAPLSSGSPEDPASAFTAPVILGKEEEGLRPAGVATMAGCLMVLAVAPPLPEGGSGEWEWGLFAVAASGRQLEDREGHPLRRMLISRGGSPTEEGALADGKRALKRMWAFLSST